MLTQFAELARRRGDAALADRYTVEAGRLRGNIEEHGWDGEWYRRAYFDDGTPLGSADERGMPDRCDLAKLVGPLRRRHAASGRSMAMESVDRRLVRRDDRLILLLDPPFDKSDLEPRLHQRLRSRRARKRRPVHAQRHLDRDGLRPRWAISERAWELFSLINPDHARRDAGGRSPPTASSRTSWPPMSTASRRTPAAAAGPGTPARPAGCIG